MKIWLAGIIIFLSLTVIVLSILLNRRIKRDKGHDYYSYADRLNLIKFADMYELTYQDITNRNGKLIIERAIGVLDNPETGEGHSVSDGKHLYMNYSHIENVKKGDVVCTLFLYNPKTNHANDIVARFDFVIDNMEA